MEIERERGEWQFMTLEDREADEGRMFEVRKREGFCVSEGHGEDGSLSA